MSRRHAANVGTRVGGVGVDERANLGHHNHGREPPPPSMETREADPAWDIAPADIGDDSRRRA
jgi:hypothetical protein